MSAPSWPGAELRARLAAPAQTMTELMEVLAAVEAVVPAARVWEVGVSANVAADLAGAYFRKQAHLAGLGCGFRVGGHDTPIEDAHAFVAAGVDTMVVARAFDHLLPALEARADLLDAAALADLVARERGALGLMFAAAAAIRDVFVLRPHRFAPPPPDGRVDAVAVAIAALDAMLADLAAAHPNVRLVDADDVVRHVGRAQALNERFRLAFQAPYAAPFWDELARRLVGLTRAAGTRWPKVLVVDADDTLWGGVLGEDGVDGVKLDPHAYPGKVYWEVQHALRRLRADGVLLALCSKNEPDELRAMLADHPHQVLRPSDFVAVKAGWGDKVAALRELAAELELGLDAFVFLDDAAFECEAVRARLPEVAVVQVPKHVFAYPEAVRGIAALFPAGAAEGDKTAQYHARAAAIADEARFATHDDYLASLGLRVTLRRDDPAQAARVAELSQKANQFNLTTRRYTAAEIAALMASPDHAVYALTVQDRFGDAGLTGVVVARLGDVACIEAWFLSCRVLGRGLELAPWDVVFADLRAAGCGRVEATYLPTARNAQVADFWPRVGLARDADAGRFTARLADLAPVRPAHVEVAHGGA